MSTVTLCVALALSLLPQDSHDLLRLEGPRARTAAALLELDIAERGRDWIDVVASAGDREALQRAGVTFELRIEGLEAHYVRRAAADGFDAAGGIASWLQPAFGAGSMGGFYTLAEMESVLDQMAAAYPTLCAPKVSLGPSLEGRELWMVKISDNPLVDESEGEVRIDALHHAREPQSMHTTLYFMSWLLEEYGSDPLATYLVDERELYFVPCVNPDGYEYNRQTNPNGGGLWRKNRRDNGGGVFGVDLNRNYPFQWGPHSGSSGTPSAQTYRGPSAGSEPEVQHMAAFMAQRSFRTALSAHSYSNYWLSAWAYTQTLPPNIAKFDELGALATQENGYEVGTWYTVLYPSNGVTQDQDLGVHGTLSWTPEIGGTTDGFWPTPSRIVPLAEENRLAFARTALAAGQWVRPTDVVLTDLGDGDGLFELGERVDVLATARNSGVEWANGVLYRVTSQHPDLLVVDGAASAGPHGPFTSATPVDDLVLEISAAATPGTRLPFTVTTESDGLEHEASFEVEVGGLVIVQAFDFEAAGDEGWSVGAPNTAASGNWVRADPVGTLAQPEDDHTPVGTRCWFTGQGVPGGALGAADVDGGATALLSPVIDLSSVASPRVEYWRWYSNDTGGNPGADVFEVDFSRDGGATWTSAEVVGPSGPEASGGWLRRTLDVASVVTPNANFRVRFVASDLGGGSIVEAAIDDVRILGSDSCPSPVRYCPATANAWGTTARVDVSGTTSLAANDLVLEVTDANPSGFGLFFRGDDVASAPAGNGTRCIGGALARLPILATDSVGAASLAVDLPSSGALIGDAWFVQFFYRDAMGAGFNVSDSLRITICD